MKTQKPQTETGKVENRKTAIRKAYKDSPAPSGGTARKSRGRPPKKNAEGAENVVPQKVERTTKPRRTPRPAQVKDAFADRSETTGNQTIRLNKYIAMSGKCSRRDADQLILDGKVVINGQRISEPGMQVNPGDVVVVSGAVITPEPMAYLLLHKPKNTITTAEDEQGRTTVTELIRKATPLRVFPVGRLDRNTSGLLLFTNDGELSNRLLHPKYRVEKVYKFDLAGSLSVAQEQQLLSGVVLEDGTAKAYFIQAMDPTRTSFKLGVHEGRNHLIRRMLETVGAKILRLKRTDFANMKLGDLEPGEWRFLTEEEVNKLRKLTDLAPLKMKA